ncbi:hypothetical protein [Microbacterium sp. NPDC096154]|uniref:hypothetical protein n=1 Tax=Microbacterium sp. NPDC096154 TaxID=3155549 RepID=UPI00332FF16B
MTVIEQSASAPRLRRLAAPEVLYDVHWNPCGHARLPWADAEAQLARVGGVGGGAGIGGAEWVRVVSRAGFQRWVQVLGDAVVGIVVEVGDEKHGRAYRVGRRHGDATPQPMPSPYSWWAVPTPKASELWTVSEAQAIARSWILQRTLPPGCWASRITDLQGRKGG